MKSLLITTLLLAFAGCAISPANITSRTPNQSFSVSGVAPDSLASKIVAIVEGTYPFRHYSTSVVPSGDGITVRSHDQVRGGYVLWIELTRQPSATSVRIFIPSDLYWDASGIARKLRADIEAIAP